MSPRDAARRALAAAAHSADELREWLDITALWPHQDAEAGAVVGSINDLHLGRFDFSTSTTPGSGGVGHKKY